MTRTGRHDNLRCGFTTGACAAAAARAAMTSLVNQAAVKTITITLPNGDHPSFEVEYCTFNSAHSKCCVVKDAGDDPDITNGAEICAEVSWSGVPGIRIEGGTGVGKVTKPGLEIPVGNAAINPVPLKMIAAEIAEVTRNYAGRRGIKAVISVPKGVDLAKRTLNSRLGIVGGVSILGTTGIVIPYSVNAYKACISQSLDVAVACGCDRIVLTTGRRSEKFAQQEMKLGEECYILAGDFIGFSLKECVLKSISQVIIWGMPGKVSKLAAGALYTNVSHSAIDTTFLIQVARKCGVPEKLLDELTGTVSANHFLQEIPAEHAGCFTGTLCSLAATRCSESVGGILDVECMMADFDGRVLGRGSSNANK
jgi:cobalt-precorrin-5B (C1)-methyltransferase